MWHSNIDLEIDQSEREKLGHNMKKITSYLTERMTGAADCERNNEAPEAHPAIALCSLDQRSLDQ